MAVRKQAERAARKPIIDALRGKKTERVPCWFMRQAGRYLPEYRELRAKAGSFLDLCFTPDMAAEVTLQPIRRFDMDAAILFSDILVVPYGLGQQVGFVQGEGPKLDAIRTADDLSKLDIDAVNAHVAPVFETVRRVRAELPDDKALLGFAGSPWTVACYMLHGGSSKDSGFAGPCRMATENDALLDAVIDILVPSTVGYLSEQVKAGADAVQLFDSWAGLLPPEAFAKYAIAPTRKIVDAFRALHPDTPVIGFPRGADRLYPDYIRATGIDAVGLDQGVDLDYAKTGLQPLCPVQGNLDPELLLAGGDAMRDAARDILDALSGGPFIFNLGHGVIKETPPEHVAQLCDVIRNYQR